MRGWEHAPGVGDYREHPVGRDNYEPTNRDGDDDFDESEARMGWRSSERGHRSVGRGSSRQSPAIGTVAHDDLVELGLWSRHDQAPRTVRSISEMPIQVGARPECDGVEKHAGLVDLRFSLLRLLRREKRLAHLREKGDAGGAEYCDGDDDLE